LPGAGSDGCEDDGCEEGGRCGEGGETGRAKGHGRGALTGLDAERADVELGRSPCGGCGSMEEGRSVATPAASLRPSAEWNPHLGSEI
jgi:hypothetical protein